MGAHLTTCVKPGAAADPGAYSPQQVRSHALKGAQEYDRQPMVSDGEPDGIAPPPDARRPGPPRCAASAAALDTGEAKPVAAASASTRGQKGKQKSGGPFGSLVEARGTLQWSVDVSIFRESAVKELQGLAICSEPFAIPAASASKDWKLVWMPFDFNQSTVSLYLKNIAPAEQLQSGVFVNWTMAVKNEVNHHTLVMMFCKAGSSVVSVDMAILDSRNHILHAPPAMAQGGPSRSDTSGMDLRNAADGSLIVGDLGLPKGVHVVEIAVKPRIMIVENFVSDGEVKSLIALAEPELKRSRVSSGQETPSRTSSSCFLTGRKEMNPALIALEERIQVLVGKDIFLEGGRKPLKRNEALQVVKYEKGEFYREHFDNKAGHPNQRAATFMMYLNDCPAGGATFFPKGEVHPSFEAKFISGGPTSMDMDHAAPAGACSSSGPAKPGGRPAGIRILPRKGRAVIFWSRMPDGEEDPASIHAAEPVDAGEKWISTRWLREFNPEGSFC